MADWPFVSIVVPVFNGADIIEELLVSLLALSYPTDQYEIIVVDNGSTDNTRQVVEKYPVKLLEEKEIQGPAAARNKGIRHAQGDIIAFTDADCVADSNWLKMLVADHANQTIGGFLGDIQGREPAHTKVEAITNRYRSFSPFRLETEPNGTEKKVLQLSSLQPRGALERLWVRLGLITYYQKHSSLPPLCTGSTGNVAYRRVVFEKVGIFDVELKEGEDQDLSWRVQLNTDYKLQPAPQAVIYHRHVQTIKELFLRGQRAGLGRIFILSNYMELDANLRWQVVLESCLNIIFGFPLFLALLGYRCTRCLVYGQPYSMYLYEPLVFWVGDVSYNYGRAKACITGVPKQKCKSPIYNKI